MDIGKYKCLLSELKGKTIAVVYIFENEDAAGSEHYWIWKSDIISGWINAIQELGCVPYILDVRTFVQKAMSRTLPCIDYVLNLNCGSLRLSTMSLIPATCSFLHIPCIPCDAVAIVTGENKLISNLIAHAKGLNVPQTIATNRKDGIFRPLCLGSSIGVHMGPETGTSKAGIYQEFIPGYDITFPLVFNPMIESLDLFPPLIYIPKTKDPNWIYDAEEKERDNGFTTCVIKKVDDEVKKLLLSYASVFPISTYGRIDARLRCNNILPSSAKNLEVHMEDLYFVEINSMPTIERDDSFDYAFSFISKEKSHPFYPCADIYKTIIQKPSINGFLLSCSVLSLKPRVEF